MRRRLIILAPLLLLAAPALADKAEDQALKAEKSAYTRVMIEEKTYEARQLDRAIRNARATWARPWLARGNPDAPKVIEYDFSGYREIFERWASFAERKGTIAKELARTADGPAVAKRLLTRLLDALSDVLRQNRDLVEFRPRQWGIHDEHPSLYRYGDYLYADALVEALGALRRPETLAWLLKDGRKRVEKWEKSRRSDLARIALLDALARTGRPEALPVLAAAAEGPSRRLRIVGLEGLATLPEERAALRDRLTEVLATEKVYAVRVAAIEILGKKLRDPRAVPALARALDRELQGPSGVLRAHLLKALREIVGRDLGPAPESWTAWYKANEKAIRDGTWKRGEDVREGKKQDPDAKDSVAFYDIRTLSKRIVVLIDASDTLIKPVDVELAKTKNYFEWRALAKKDRNFVSQYDLLRQETSKMVSMLPASARFNLLLMNGSYKITPFFPRGMAHADPETKRRVDPWLAKVIVGGWAPQIMGIWEAFKLAGYDPFAGGIPEEPAADTIFLLSDGVPSGGQFMYAPALVDDVRRHHRFTRIPIHTIRIDDYKDSAETVMKGVAEVTGGTYVWRKKP